MFKTALTTYSPQSFLMKLGFSAIMSTLMYLTITILEGNPILIVFVFTFLNYISLEMVLMLFSRSVTSFFDKVINELYEIQRAYISDSRLTHDKKEVLTHKFIHVQGHFLKTILSIQYLRNNRYNPELEIDNVLAIATTTVDLYVEDMLKTGVSQELIDCFQEIHRPATEEFIEKLNDSIRNEKVTIVRRAVFLEELVKLMKESVEHFIKATEIIENNK